jgi:hypothetical protein
MLLQLLLLLLLLQVPQLHPGLPLSPES